MHLLWRQVGGGLAAAAIVTSVFANPGTGHAQGSPIPAITAKSAPKPKTIAGCRKAFKGKAKTKARSACIKRVEREKYGNCQHKFKAGTTGTENYGDQAELSVEVVGYDSNLPQGSTEHLRLKVINHKPSQITICAKAELKLWSKPHNEEFGPGVLHTFFVTVPPGGGLSSEVETEVGQYMAFAWARPTGSHMGQH